MHSYPAMSGARPAGETWPLSVRPLAISAAVRAGLLDGALLVRAVHRTGVSLRPLGSEDAVFVSGRGSGLLPSHVVVRARDRDRLLRMLDRGAFRPGSSGEGVPLHVDLAGVRTFRCGLEPAAAALNSPRARSNMVASARWLRSCSPPVGMGPAAAELLAVSGRWLHEAVSLRAGATPPIPGLRGLIGRGAGTTPAGDDLVVGALAWTWATRGGAAPIIEALRRLALEFPALTTTAGGTYLRAAARGEFGSHLVAWARALPRASPERVIALARRVAAHGATSGMDTLAGFFAAANV